VKVAIVGYGRMGREVETAARSRGHSVVARIDPAGGGRGVTRRLDGAAFRRADVAFEFTVPASAEGNVIALLEAGVAVVCGTTGWDASSRAVAAASRRGRRGAVIAPNFSVGMTLFSQIVADAAGGLLAAGGYDPFVLEAHHRGKIDAPSGTALRLASAVAAAGAARAEIVAGIPVGRVRPGAVHVASLRAGLEPGTHTVGFDGVHDVITLCHRARDRGGLALGAVLAAEWIVGRRGVHGFEDVVGDVIGRRARQ
jgi:4-hydroxy-tetrahydrodipicolinate reductase